MRAAIAASMTLVLSACATAPAAPSMHPLTQARIDAMGPTPFSVTENNEGVGKSWTYTSSAAAGANFGLIGALTSAVIDVIVNWGPSHRAQKSADELAELEPPSALNTAQLDRLKQLVAATPAPGISIAQVTSAQKLFKTDPLDDTVEIATFYALSEDATVLRVIANASYRDAKAPFVSPYPAKYKVDKDTSAYRNTFTYYSTPLPVPQDTPELAERLVASIEDSARDAAGALPAETSREYKAMQKEIAEARDGKLSKAETSIFMAREWTKDDGALLRREVARANDFIARYVLLDLNRVAVPTVDGVDERLETADDKRTVRRIGAGPQAGSYVSSAGDVTTFATYGNTMALAVVNRERIADLKKQAK